MKKIILRLATITLFALGACKKEAGFPNKEEKFEQIGSIKNKTSQSDMKIDKAIKLKQDDYINNFLKKNIITQEKTRLNSATLLSSNTIFAGTNGPGCSSSPYDVTQIYFNVVTIESFHCNMNDMNFSCYFGSASSFSADDIILISTDWNQPGVIIRTFNVRFDIPTSIYHNANNNQIFTTTATSYYSSLPQSFTENNLDISSYGINSVNTLPSANPGAFTLDVNLCYPNSQLQPNSNSVITFYNILNPSIQTTITFIPILFTSGYVTPAGQYNYTITPHYDDGNIGLNYSGTFVVN